MTAVIESAEQHQTHGPFDLGDDAAYRQWRAVKLAQRAHAVSDLIVAVNDPCALTTTERQALLQRCARWNMAVYRCAQRGQDKDSARALGHQLGLRRLDSNWLADDDGISSITVHRRQPIAVPGAGLAQSVHAAAGSDTSHSADARANFIPFTDRPIKWHTDGYYHPDSRRIRAMILHCVRPARDGGVNALLDHELAYIALRDASPRWTRALMAPDAMTIPGREDATGVVRAAQTGPVFSVDPVDGCLHMRYTARARSIEWKADVATQKAVAFLARYLNDDNADVVRVQLESGMGIVANNVLHDRSGFVDDPAHPRLLLRARYLDRIPAQELA
jgi:hypothetical protein